MTFQFEEREPFLIARVRVRSLDVGNAGALKEALASAVGEQPRRLILDLSAIEEIDSAGLGALVAVLKWTRRFGGSMRVCGLRKTVRDVLELTMLHRILPLHESVEDALAEEAAACRD